MITLFKKMTAAAASAMLTVCSVGAYPALADTTDEPAAYLVTFDLSDEAVSIAPDEETEEIPELNDITTGANSSVFIPKVYLEKEGYTFSCWTPDGVRAYEPGDVIRVTDSDITMTPVWVNKTDKTYYSVSYTVEIDGEVLDTKKELPLCDYRAGQLVKVSMSVFPWETAKQQGWTDGTTVFTAEQKFFMPEHDVNLTPNWLYYYDIIYYAGDVDRLTSTPYNSVRRAETLITNLSDNSMFVRRGFTLTGWHCELDGKDYRPTASYYMPSGDVTFSAIWEPVNYTVLFRAGTGKSSDNIKVPGKTDDIITVPEMTASKDGYVFAGWKYNDTIYNPGDDFLIEGELPGVGIALEAVWEKEGESITTTTEPPTAPMDYPMGDANMDKEVSMADAVLIMQYVANPDKYGVNGTDENHITEEGLVFADAYDPGSGVTSRDALSIQMYMLEILPSLPELDPSK